MDDVARAALKKYNPMSIFKNREYGGIIFRTKNGDYGYTRGRLGTGRTAPPMKDSLGGMPKDATIVGQYHTHGDYVDQLSNRTNKAGDSMNSDNFSPKDKTVHLGLSKQLPHYDSSYLGTPSGIFKYMPKGSDFPSILP